MAFTHSRQRPPLQPLEGSINRATADDKDGPDEQKTVQVWLIALSDYLLQEPSPPIVCLASEAYMRN